MGSRLHRIRLLLREEFSKDWEVERSCEHCQMSIPPMATMCFRCGRDIEAWPDDEVA